MAHIGAHDTQSQRERLRIPWHGRFCIVTLPPRDERRSPIHKSISQQSRDLEHAGTETVAEQQSRSITSPQSRAIFSIPVTRSCKANHVAVQLPPKSFNQGAIPLTGIQADLQQNQRNDPPAKGDISHDSSTTHEIAQQTEYLMSPYESSQDLRRALSDGCLAIKEEKTENNRNEISADRISNISPSPQLYLGSPSSQSPKGSSGSSAEPLQETTSSPVICVTKTFDPKDFHTATLNPLARAFDPGAARFCEEDAAYSDTYIDHFSGIKRHDPMLKFPSTDHEAQSSRTRTMSDGCIANETGLPMETDRSTRPSQMFAFQQTYPYYNISSDWPSSQGYPNRPGPNALIRIPQRPSIDSTEREHGDSVTGPTFDSSNREHDIVMGSNHNRASLYSLPMSISSLQHDSRFNVPDLDTAEPKHTPSSTETIEGHTCAGMSDQETHDHKLNSYSIEQIEGHQGTQFGHAVGSIGTSSKASVGTPRETSSHKATAAHCRFLSDPQAHHVTAEHTDKHDEKAERNRSHSLEMQCVGRPPYTMPDLRHAISPSSPSDRLPAENKEQDGLNRYQPPGVTDLGSIIAEPKQSFEERMNILLEKSEGALRQAREISHAMARTMSEAVETGALRHRSKSTYQAVDEWLSHEVSSGSDSCQLHVQVQENPDSARTEQCSVLSNGHPIIPLSSPRSPFLSDNAFRKSRSRTQKQVVQAHDEFLRTKDAIKVPSLFNAGAVDYTPASDRPVIGSNATESSMKESGIQQQQISNKKRYTTLQEQLNGLAIEHLMTQEHWRTQYRHLQQKLDMIQSRQDASDLRKRQTQANPHRPISDVRETTLKASCENIAGQDHVEKHLCPEQALVETQTCTNEGWPSLLARAATYARQNLGCSLQIVETSADTSHPGSKDLAAGSQGSAARSRLGITNIGSAVSGDRENLSPTAEASVQGQSCPEDHECGAASVSMVKALSETISILQEQLQDRESQMEQLQVDYAAKLEGQNHAFSWFQELLELQNGETEMLIKALRHRPLNLGLLEKLTIRLQTNLHMIQQTEIRDSPSQAETLALSDSTLSYVPKVPKVAADSKYTAESSVMHKTVKSVERNFGQLVAKLSEPAPQLPDKYQYFRNSDASKANLQHALHANTSATTSASIAGFTSIAGVLHQSKASNGLQGSHDSEPSLFECQGYDGDASEAPTSR